jgi:hypothetical protein
MKKSKTRVESLLDAVSVLVDYRGKVQEPDDLPLEDNLPPGSWLVVWQCGFEPMVIAVAPDAISSMADAEDSALDYLRSKNWFGASGERECDFAIQLTVSNS